jgi:hypothetical protein
VNQNWCGMRDINGESNTIETQQNRWSCCHEIAIMRWTGKKWPKDQLAQSKITDPKHF